MMKTVVWLAVVLVLCSIEGLPLGFETPTGAGVGAGVGLDKDGVSITKETSKTSSSSSESTQRDKVSDSGKTKDGTYQREGESKSTQKTQETQKDTEKDKLTVGKGGLDMDKKKTTSGSRSEQSENQKSYSEKQEGKTANGQYYSEKSSEEGNKHDRQEKYGSEQSSGSHLGLQGFQEKKKEGSSYSNVTESNQSYKKTHSKEEATYREGGTTQNRKAESDSSQQSANQQQTNTQNRYAGTQNEDDANNDQQPGDASQSDSLQDSDQLEIYDNDNEKDLNGNGKIRTVRHVTGAGEPINSNGNYRSGGGYHGATNYGTENQNYGLNYQNHGFTNRNGNYEAGNANYAAGNGNYAAGNGNYAAGNGNYGPGNGKHVTGNGNYAAGIVNHAFGNANHGFSNHGSEGVIPVSGIKNYPAGVGNYAPGQRNENHAYGNENHAFGNENHGFGAINHAVGIGSYAVGNEQSGTAQRNGNYDVGHEHYGSGLRIGQFEPGNVNYVPVNNNYRQGSVSYGTGQEHYAPGSVNYGGHEHYGNDKGNYVFGGHGSYVPSHVNYAQAESHSNAGRYPVDNVYQSPVHYENTENNKALVGYLNRNSHHIPDQRQVYSNANQESRTPNTVLSKTSHIFKYLKGHSIYDPSTGPASVKHVNENEAYGSIQRLLGGIDLHGIIDETPFLTGNGRYVLIPGKDKTKHRYYDTVTKQYFNIRHVKLSGNGKTVIVPGDHDGSAPDNKVPTQFGSGLYLGHGIYYLGNSQYSYQDKIISASDISTVLKGLGLSFLLTRNGLPMGHSNEYYPMDLGFGVFYLGNGYYRFEDQIISSSKIVEFTKTHSIKIVFTKDGYPTSILNGAKGSGTDSTEYQTIDLGNGLRFLDNGHYIYNDQVIPATNIFEFLKTVKFSVPLTPDGLPYGPYGGPLQDGHSLKNLGYGVYELDDGNYRYLGQVIPAAKIRDFLKSLGLTDKVPLTDDRQPTSDSKDTDDKASSPQDLGYGIQYLGNKKYKYEDQIISATEITKFVTVLGFPIKFTPDGLPLKSSNGTQSTTDDSKNDVNSPNDKDNFTKGTTPDGSDTNGKYLGDEIYYIGKNYYKYHDHIIKASKMAGLLKLIGSNITLPTDDSSPKISNGTDKDSTSDNDDQVVHLGNGIDWLGKGLYRYKDHIIPKAFMPGLLNILGIHMHLPADDDNDNSEDADNNCLNDLGHSIYDCGNGTYRYKNRYIPEIYFEDFLKILGYRLAQGKPKTIIGDGPGPEDSDDKTTVLIDILLSKKKTDDIDDKSAKSENTIDSKGTITEIPTTTAASDIATTKRSEDKNNSGASGDQHQNPGGPRKPVEVCDDTDENADSDFSSSTTKTATSFNNTTQRPTTDSNSKSTDNSDSKSSDNSKDNSTTIKTTNSNSDSDSSDSTTSTTLKDSGTSLTKKLKKRGRKWKGVRPGKGRRNKKPSIKTSEVDKTSNDSGDSSDNRSKGSKYSDDTDQSNSGNANRAISSEKGNKKDRKLNSKDVRSLSTSTAASKTNSTSSNETNLNQNSTSNGNDKKGKKNINRSHSDSDDSDCDKNTDDKDSSSTNGGSITISKSFHSNISDTSSDRTSSGKNNGRKNKANRKGSSNTESTESNDDDDDDWSSNENFKRLNENDKTLNISKHESLSAQIKKSSDDSSSSDGSNSDNTGSDTSSNGSEYTDSSKGNDNTEDENSTRSTTNGSGTDSSSNSSNSNRGTSSRSDSDNSENNTSSSTNSDDSSNEYSNLLAAKLRKAKSSSTDNVDYGDSSSDTSKNSDNSGDDKVAGKHEKSGKGSRESHASQNSSTSHQSSSSEQSQSSSQSQRSSSNTEKLDSNSQNSSQQRSSSSQPSSSESSLDSSSTAENSNGGSSSTSSSSLSEQSSESSSSSSQKSSKTNSNENGSDESS